MYFSRKMLSNFDQTNFPEEASIKLGKNGEKTNKLKKEWSKISLKLDTISHHFFSFFFFSPFPLAHFPFIRALNKNFVFSCSLSYSLGFSDKNTQK